MLYNNWRKVVYKALYSGHFICYKANSGFAFSKKIVYHTKAEYNDPILRNIYHLASLQMLQDIIINPSQSKVACPANIAFNRFVNINYMNKDGNFEIIYLQKKYNSSIYDQFYISTMNPNFKWHPVLDDNDKFIIDKPPFYCKISDNDDNITNDKFIPLIKNID